MLTCFSVCNGSGNAVAYGGTFSTVFDYNHYDKIEGCVAEGYEAVQNEDGSFTVSLILNDTETDGLKKDEFGNYHVYTAEAFLAMAASHEGVIELHNDIDFGGASITTIAAAYGKDLVFNGNGYKLSNAKILPGPHNGMKNYGLFYAYTNCSLTVNDLVIENMIIDSTNDTERNYGAGIIVGYCDGNSNVTLNNVDVYDCTIINNVSDIGDEAGVYVGYMSGTTLNMTDCDSVGCTVAGETAEKTGAMIGMVNTSCTATLTNCTTDLTIGTCNRVTGTLIKN